MNADILPHSSTNNGEASETAETLLESLQKERKKVVEAVTSSSWLLLSTSLQRASISSATMRRGQELPQLEADYDKTGMQKIITTVGNVVSGSARD